MSETFITITPFGRVDAVFTDDGEGVTLQGPDDAVAHVQRVVAGCTDSNGMRVTLDTMEPATYFYFCQPEGSDVQIIAPADFEASTEGVEDPEAPDPLDGVATEVMDSADEPDELESICRQAYLDYFHKVAATTDYQRFRGIFRTAWRAACNTPNAAMLLDGVEGAVTTLQIALDMYTNNEPIHRAEGNEAQADLCARYAADIREALRLLGAAPEGVMDAAVAEPLEVNSFKSGDKVVSLDNNRDFVVTGQRGFKVSVKGQAEWIHANRLKLASGAKPARVVLDEAEEAQALLPPQPDPAAVEAQAQAVAAAVADPLATVRGAGGALAKLAAARALLPAAPAAPAQPAPAASPADGWPPNDWPPADPAQPALTDEQRNAIAKDQELFAKYGNSGEGSRAKWKEAARTGQMDRLWPEHLANVKAQEDANKAFRRAKNDAWREKNLPRLQEQARRQREAEAAAALEADRQREAQRQAAERDKAAGGTQRIYLRVPFAEKDEAKRYGARWDGERRLWFYAGAELPDSLKRWMPKPAAPAAAPAPAPAAASSDRIYLRVPFDDRESAKRQGARWDPTFRAWFYPGSELPEELKRWLPSAAPAQTGTGPRINPAWKAHNDLYNEGGEGFNPHPKYLPAAAPAQAAAQAEPKRMIRGQPWTHESALRFAGNNVPGFDREAWLADVRKAFPEHYPASLRDRLPTTGRVSADDPSIYGEWLLGREGELWADVRRMAPETGRLDSVEDEGDPDDMTPEDDALLDAAGDAVATLMTKLAAAGSAVDRLAIAKAIQAVRTGVGDDGLPKDPDAAWAALLAANAGDSRAAGKAYLKLLQGHQVQTVIGAVRLTGKTSEKMRAGLGNNELKAALIPRVPDILRGDYLGSNVSPKVRADGMDVFHYFAATVRIRDLQVTAGVSVGERTATGDKVLTAYELVTELFGKWAERTKGAPLNPGHVTRGGAPSAASKLDDADSMPSDPEQGNDEAEGLNIVILQVVDADGNEVPGMADSPAPARTARQIAEAIAKANPGGDVLALREQARQAIIAELGEGAAAAIADTGNWLRGDDLTKAIHDGQYQALREFAASLPVPVSEDDIPMATAVGAYDRTSHSPERRGASARRGYVQALVSAWRLGVAAAGDNPEALARVTEIFRDLVAGYRSRTLAALSAHSRVASSMIVGPANFPVRAMQKRSETADRRAEEAADFLKAGIAKMQKAARGPVDNSPDSELQRIQANIAEREKAQERMKAANAAVRKGDDAALQAMGFTDRQIAELKTPDFAGRRGFADYALTNNNAEIRRLRQRLADAEARVAAAAAGPTERTEGGVRIVEDAQDDRLRLFFPGKPADAVREALKSSGFRWSPMAGAWQRGLTDNARRAAKDILAKFYPEGAKLDSVPGSEPEDQRAADLATLASIVAGTHPLMFEPELSEVIEDILAQYPDDDEVRTAVDAATEACMRMEPALA